MMEEEFKRRGHLVNMDPLEAVLDWSNKLIAIGEISGSLSLYENRLTGSMTQSLYDHGETLGQIIADYARAINETTTENYKSWQAGERTAKQKSAPEAVRAAAGA